MNHIIRWLPPAVALLVVGSWMGIQRRSIATMQADNVMLCQQLAAARPAVPDGDSPPAKPAGLDQLAKDNKGRTDWKKLAGQLAAMEHGGMGDLRTMIRLQQRVQAMTRDELVAALDEIAALDLPDASRSMLEQLLIDPLIRQDPELALTRFSHRLQDGPGALAWQLGLAFREWAKKDADQAIRWFDQQIAAGKFASKSLDGRSQARIQFEAMLMGDLLAADPAAAARRLAAMPEDQRAEVMRNGSPSALKEADQLTFAKLVRENVPANEQAQLFSKQASQLAKGGGYDQVTAYLERIAATPAERTACVEQAASSLLIRSNDKPATTADFEALRAWVGSQAPDATERVTGRLLGEATQGNGKMAFSEAGALAVQYSQAGGTDEVLGAFLDSRAARENKEQARVLAEKITDEKRRTAILKSLE